MKRMGMLGLMVIFFITSCHKKEVLVTTEPENAIKTTSLQFRITGVPQTSQQLYALVSMQNNSGEFILLNRKMAMNFQHGKYVTDSVPVNSGDYKILKFLVTAGSDTALYATPKLLSARQSEVNAPLSQNLMVKADEKNLADIQTLSIRSSDTPESFGYTEEEFGYVAFLKVKLHLSMTVGNQRYDSLSGTLKIDAVHANGTHWRKEVVMTPGMNTVSVPEQYYSYEFAVEKWLVRPGKTITRNEIPGAVIELTATRNAKQLAEESTFVESQGMLNPDSRTEYVYNANSSLKEIHVFGKLTDKPGLNLTQKSIFAYRNGLVDSIKRYSDSNKLVASLAVFYQDGKIISMRNGNAGDETSAAFSYFQVPGANEIGARYVYPNGNTMTYNMRYQQGNLFSDAAFSSTGGSESGEYAYDENINPYQQLNIPDVFLSGRSKNNKTSEKKLYSGGFPTSVPYKFEYAYDGDGYPKELWTSFRGYSSGNHLFRVKKIFKYR